jgi:N-acetylmuramic acid 6-phosphate etherase
MSEDVHPRADELDELSTLELLAVMHAEDRRAVDAVRAQLPLVAAAIDQVADRLRSGGRLHYFGAGTSGRLAALDAAECPATFGIDPSLVQAHVAADGEAEDDRRQGETAASLADLGRGDAAIGISASGRTAFVLAAIGHARAAGALVVSVTCAAGSPLGALADVAIAVETGPEVIAGSTRLKAGTVQKVVLNMISTGVFTRLGHTYRGRMVDVLAANDKLRARAELMVTQLAGVPAVQAAQALADAGGNPKVAILMLRRGVTADEARERLATARGDLSSVLAEVRP